MFLSVGFPCLREKDFLGAKYFVSTKFGQLIIFHKQWSAYIKTKRVYIYEKFLDLWKDAVPGIAEVEDAKKRVAGLKGK